MFKHLLIVFLFVFTLSAQADNKANEIKVYRSPDCQCCHKWIQHLEQNDFTVLNRLKFPKKGLLARRALIA